MLTYFILKKKKNIIYSLTSHCCSTSLRSAVVYCLFKPPPVTAATIGQLSHIWAGNTKPSFHISVAAVFATTAVLGAWPRVVTVQLRHHNITEIWRLV